MSLFSGSVSYDPYGCTPLEPPRPDQTKAPGAPFDGPRHSWSVPDGAVRAAPGIPGACLPYDNRAADERDREALHAALATKTPWIKVITEEVNEPYRGGYPFMALAKKHGVAYEDVLEFSLPYHRPSPLLSSFNWYAVRERLPQECKREIADLMNEPVWARGGPHSIHADDPEAIAYWAARGQ